MLTQQLDAIDSEDAALMARIGGADGAALSALYDRYSGVVFGALCRMLPTPEAAETVCQTVFDHVWRSPATNGSAGGSVRTWLIITVRRLASEWRVSHAAAGLPVTPPAPTHDSDKVLLMLPVDQRETLALALWAGLTQREIAERLDTSIDTVKSRIRLAMATLRDLERSASGAVVGDAEPVPTAPNGLDVSAAPRLVAELTS